MLWSWCRPAVEKINKYQLVGVLVLPAATELSVFGLIGT
jgi:hypothetical protein